MVFVVLVSKTCFICYYLQQVYMYFRGSGKAAEMKRDAARGTMRAALWRGTYWAEMLFVNGFRLICSQSWFLELAHSSHPFSACFIQLLFWCVFFCILILKDES